jgi:hypothetical protein
MQLKTAFVVTLVLKISFGFFAWGYGFLQRGKVPEDIITSVTWGLGFFMPLLIMIVYMIYGYNKVKGKSHSELLSFGDSCYYLGFLFTITSIILAMADIRGDSFIIGDIAIRFAAAMVTTLLGMAMRVYLVTFSRRPLPAWPVTFGQVSGNGAISDGSNGISSSEGSNSTEENGSSDKEKADQKNLLGGQAADNGTGTSSALASVQPDMQMRPYEATADDGLDMVVEANLRNLDLLNRELNTCFWAFEKLRNNVLNSSARLTNEFTEQQLQLKKFHSAMQEQISGLLNENLDSYKKELKKHMNSLGDSVEEGANSLSGAISVGASQIREATQQMTETLSIDEETQGLKTAMKGFLDSLNSTTGQLKESSEKYPEVIKNTAEKLHETVSQSSTNLSNLVSNAERELGTSVIKESSVLGSEIAKLTEALNRTVDSLGSLDSGFKTQLDKGSEEIHAQTLKAKEELDRYAASATAGIAADIEKLNEALAKTVSVLSDLQITVKERTEEASEGTGSGAFKKFKGFFSKK